MTDLGICHETGINKNDSGCLVDSDARADSESHGSHGGHVSHVCTTVTAVTVVPADTSASDPARGAGPVGECGKIPAPLRGRIGVFQSPRGKPKKGLES